MSRRGRVLLVVVGLGLGLLLAEALLAGPLRPEVVDDRDADWQQRLRRMHTAVYQPDPELAYVPRPGARFEMDYGVVQIDALGLRSHAPVVEEGDGRTRVALLGDSLVWGELLPVQEAVPAVLERALGEEVQVLNLGVSGYDTVQEEAWYRRAGRPLQPDVVVLVYCLNDMLTMSGPLHIHGTDEQIAAWTRERAGIEAAAPIRNETISRAWLEDRRGGGSQVMAALRHVLRWHRLFTLPGGYTDEILLAAGDEKRRSRTAQALQRLGDDLREDGAVPVLVISPALYWWHRYQWDEVHAFVRAQAEAAGFVVLDPLDDWRGKDPTPYRYGGDNLHYTPEGVELLVDWLAPRLQEQLPPG